MLRIGPLFTILLATALGLTACEPQAPSPAEPGAGIRVDERMAAPPDPGFARALEPRAFSFPADHGAHPDFATEWWYFTGNLHDDEGQRFGYQLTLFRVGLRPGAPDDDSDWRARQLYMGHLAISDIGARRHHHAGRFSRAAMGLAGARPEPLSIWLGPWSIRGSTDGPFPVRLSAATDDIAIDLTVQRGDKALVLQGDRGLSRKGAAPGNASYYYSYTRLPTHGTIRLGDRRHAVDGSSWFDREWSSSALAADQAGWDWFALQLDDGRDLMFYRMRGRDGLAQPFSSGTLVAADGHATPLSLADVDARPLRYWQAHDGVRYPVEWQVKVAAQGLDLRVSAAFDAQEMRHTVRYWEGAVTVTGSQRGVGYLELAGYAD